MDQQPTRQLPAAQNDPPPTSTLSQSTRRKMVIALAVLALVVGVPLSAWMVAREISAAQGFAAECHGRGGIVAPGASSPVCVVPSGLPSDSPLQDAVPPVDPATTAELLALAQKPAAPALEERPRVFRHHSAPATAPTRSKHRHHAAPAPGPRANPNGKVPPGRAKHH